jgi:hypothetical protein
MSVWLPILAQPLAPDCIGLAALFLIALAFLRGLGSVRNRLAESRPAWHCLHELHRQPHEPVSHGHP